MPRERGSVSAPLKNTNPTLVEFGALHTAREILNSLERRGIKINLDGKDHIVIEPAVPLPIPDLVVLTQNKEAILKYLRLRCRA
jgi:hypothetical protein